MALWDGQSTTSSINRTRPLRVFVFNSTLSCIGFVDGKFRWQQGVRWLVPAAMLVDSPSLADLVYHPACLVDAYFHNRIVYSGEWRSANREIEGQVLQDISKYSPGTPVMINALRCTSADVTSATVAYRTLWRWPGTQVTLHSEASTAHAPFARVCGEAMVTWGRAQPLQPCSLYMPYLTESADSAEIVERPPTKRDIDVLFIGSAMPKRWWYLRAIRNMSATHRVHILSLKAARLNRQSRAIDGELSATSRSLMARAKFTVCPPGDTPESERIYQALQHGSIPLVNDRFNGPPFVNWSAISFPLIVNTGTGLELPSPQRTAELHANIAELVSRQGILRWDSQALSHYVGAQLERIADQCFGLRRRWAYRGSSRTLAFR